MTTLEIYKYRCEAQGLSWADYCDCDEWTLSMLFDVVEYDEDGEDY